MDESAKWFVVHTYSGYENKVKANIEKIIENRRMQDQIFEIRVPIQNFVEIRNGQRKTVQRKLYPGYVLINMIMNDNTWYVVRNTRGVTSFVGPGSKPVPLTEKEIVNMGIKPPNEDDVRVMIGDNVRIITGPFEGSIGLISEVNANKHTVIVRLSVFGRETPVELNFTQIQVVE